MYSPPRLAVIVTPLMCEAVAKPDFPIAVHGLCWNTSSEMLGFCNCLACTFGLHVMFMCVL